MPDFMCYGVPLPHQRMSRVAPNSPSLILNDENAGELIFQSRCFRLEVEAIRHKIDRHRNPIGFALAEYALGLLLYIVQFLFLHGLSRVVSVSIVPKSLPTMFVRPFSRSGFLVSG